MYDDKEAAITQAEFRIRAAVQKDVEERWKTRMENEGKITTNAFEALRSEVTLMRVAMFVTSHPGWCKTLSLPPKSNLKDGLLEKHSRNKHYVG